MTHVILLALFSATALAQPGPILAGRVPNPPGLSGSMTAYAFYLSADRFRAIASGSFGGDGTFSVALPAELSDDVLYAVDQAAFCADGTGTLNVLPAGAKHAIVMYPLAIIGEQGIGAILASTAEVFDRLGSPDGDPRAGDYFIAFLYAAEPLQVSGNCVDAQNGTEFGFDLDAPRGWSLIQYGFGIRSGEGLVLRTVPQVPSDAAWHPVNE